MWRIREASGKMKKKVVFEKYNFRQQLRDIQFIERLQNLQNILLEREGILCHSHLIKLNLFKLSLNTRAPFYKLKLDKKYHRQRYPEEYITAICTKTKIKISLM